MDLVGKQSLWGCCVAAVCMIPEGFPLLSMQPQDLSVLLRNDLRSIHLSPCLLSRTITTGSLDPSPGHCPIPPGLSAESSIENLNTMSPSNESPSRPSHCLPTAHPEGPSHHFSRPPAGSQAHMQIRGFVYVVPCLSTLESSGMLCLVLKNCIVPPQPASQTRVSYKGLSQLHWVLSLRLYHF